VQRLAGFRIDTLLTGHGQPMAGATMRRDLRDLAERFDERARPRRGRYVEHDEGELAFEPRRSAVTTAALVAGITAAVALAWFGTARRRPRPVGRAA
jgi:hypothetical protein